VSRGGKTTDKRKQSIVWLNVYSTKGLSNFKFALHYTREFSAIEP